MPKSSPIYTSFTSGELSPFMQGRVDLEQYYKGCKDAKNLLATQYGPILNRPGTTYVEEVYKPYSNFFKPILIPHTSGSLGHVVIEITPAFGVLTGFMRFFNNDGVIESGGSPVTIAHSFYADELFEINYDQDNETVILSHPNRRPLEIVRTAADAWSVSNFDFVGAPYQLDNTDQNSTITLQQSTNSTTGVTEGDFVQLVAQSDFDQTGLFWKIGEPTGSPEAQGFVEITGLNSHDFTSTTGKSLTLSATTGSVTVTAGASHFTADMVGQTLRAYDGNYNPSVIQGVLEITGFTSGTVVTGNVTTTFTSTSYPAERWAVSDAKVAEAIVKSGLSVSMGETYLWAAPEWSLTRGYPGRCAFIGQRLGFARSNSKKNGIWLSKPFIYDDFNPGTGLDNDAISEAIPEANDINFILGGRTLVAGTDEGDFSIVGELNGQVTPGSWSATRQTNWGSEVIMPSWIGSFAYYVQEKGRKLRELGYSFQEDSYVAPDMTAISEHITESGIVQTAYQRNPYSILYCVLGNGKMACMMRETHQQALGWTPVDTDGEFESVASIPHPTEDHDIVFVAVKRTINGVEKRFIEKFESPYIPERVDLHHALDCALSYNAYETTTGGDLTLSGTTGSVTVTADSSIFSAGSVDEKIRAIDADGNVLGELTVTSYDSGSSGTEVDGTVTTTFSTTTYDSTRWGISADTVSGLNHLNSHAVTVLNDGVKETHTVSSNAITLDNRGFVVLGGLPYVSRYKNMEIEGGSATGTAQGKKKRIYQSAFKFYRSLGMKVGSDQLDTISDTLLTGTTETVPINSSYDNGGHIVVEQSEPYRMCILAIMPLLTTSDE